MKLNSSDDKPSCLSKRVMKVYNQNQTENLKLNEKLNRLEKAKAHNLANITESVRSLRQTSRKIKEVIKEMDVSQMRRRLFADHGCKLTEEKININELLERVDSIIYNPIGTPIPIICNKTLETRHDSMHTETNKVDDNINPDEGTDVISEENKGNEDTRPFQFRKIIPPLHGRKMEEVYKDMKQEGKQLMKVKELADFRRGSMDFEMQLNGKQKELEKEGTKRVYLECEKQNEIVKLNDSFEHLLDYEPNDKMHYNDKVSYAKSDEKAIPTVIFNSNHPKTMQNDAQEAKNDKKEDNIKNIRPMSCPPNSVANKSKVTVRAKSSYAKGVCSQKQVRRCWDEQISKGVRADYVNSTKQTTLKEMSRPISCPIPLQDEQIRSCSSPPPQRRIPRPLTTESHKRFRKPSCGNRSEISKELVYDARPRDAITSGYSTLQMRVGRKSTSVFIPKFRRVLKENEVTEKQRTNKLKMEKRRIERVKKQLELEEYRV